MAKKKLSKMELKLKKLGVVAKKYTDLKIDASKLNKYEKATANEGYLKTIILSAAKTLADATADPNRIEIDIPKDFLVKSSKLLTVVAGEGAQEGKWIVTKENNVAVAEPYEAPSTVTGAGQWLDFVINVKDGAAEVDEHIDVDLSSFIVVYTSGNGISLDNNVISIKLRVSGNDANSGLAFDANGNLYIAIDPNNANGLAITADGLKLALAQASVNGAGGAAGAMSATDKEKLDGLGVDLLTDAELASWFGYDITGTPEAGSEAETIKNTLAGVSDDSITDE